MGALVRLYYVAVCLANDMKHIHTHIKGRKFDMIHNICNEYYEKASKDADDLVELAIEYDESVMNASYAAELIKYKPANLKAYNYEEAIKFIIVLVIMLKSWKMHLLQILILMLRI